VKREKRDVEGEGECYQLSALCGIMTVVPLACPSSSSFWQAMANLSGRTENRSATTSKRQALSIIRVLKTGKADHGSRQARLIGTGRAFPSQQSGLAYRRRFYVNWKDQ
jgi:hypothetical protein